MTCSFSNVHVLGRAQYDKVTRACGSERHTELHSLKHTLVLDTIGVAVECLLGRSLARRSQGDLGTRCTQLACLQRVVGTFQARAALAHSASLHFLYTSISHQ